ncbi:hypothetical protein [Spiroplasma endosymbiont of Apeira syringaria]|uniref:hypothetical protein n=1 Tax=Spiroplasma endosymbiont of Apeira syringaria TaxID=3066307 RepID=UPI0030D0A7E0
MLFALTCFGVVINFFNKTIISLQINVPTLVPIIIKAFLPLCTILILSHKCWEKPIYGLLPTFLNQT